MYRPFEERLAKGPLLRMANITWKLMYYGRMFRDPKFRARMHFNKTYHDKYKGETCYILGNGPSLAQEESLERLADKYVISVNFLFRSAIYDQVKPNYHTLMDPAFFSLSKDTPEEKETLHKLSTLFSSDTSPILILPYEHKDFIEKNNIGNEKNIYLITRYRIHGAYRSKIKISEYLPNIQTVIHAALYAAIDMGFHRIILLGCDTTGLFDTYMKKVDGKNAENIYSHVYNYTERQKEWANSIVSTVDNEFFLSAYTRYFEIYKGIAFYAMRHKIEILNASKSTALDMFPLVDFNDVID